MEKQTQLPYEFFVVAFFWSWLIWLPLVLAGFGFLPLEMELLQKISVPISVLAACGPAVGAFYCLRKFEGQGAVTLYLRSFLDFRLGWKAWWAPIGLLGGSTCLAWVLPELWGESRIGILLPSIWLFPLDLIRRRTRRIRLAWIHSGSYGETDGSMAWKSGLRNCLGLMASAVIFYTWNQSKLYELFWFSPANYRLFLVLCLGTPTLRQQIYGRLDYSWVG